jgi:hypothetical protein
MKDPHKEPAWAPKKLRRILKRLAAGGEEAVLICPALLERHATQRMIAMARIGMGGDKALAWLVATEENVHFIRPGLLWDKVQSVPLERITDIEYVDEFRNNALRLKVGEASEKVIFYDELEGIRFYQYVKHGRWKG